ncbi:primosomal replication protein N [Herbaspirillum sp. NPDC101396]|uniref:primosomal replication protein N n=1 Tax=Herbaspirillum sp. NPDC101396 TaxID=3364005 RepID=UPI00383B1775
MNHFQFVATIAERDVIRYTPAGIPVVTAKLQHQSEQTEAGIKRLVEFEITAFAAGEISGRLNRAGLGEMLKFSGFMARRNRNSKSFVFHIVDFESVV